MKIITHKRIIAAYLVMVFLGILFLLVYIVIGGSKQDNTPAVNQSTDSVTQQKDNVSVSGTNTLSGKVSTDDLAAMRAQTYTAIRRNTPNYADHYNVSVRSGSITHEVPASGVPVTTFLIDIPAAKQTYRVRINGDDTTEYHGIYVLCPTSNELKYGAFTCSNG